MEIKTDPDIIYTEADILAAYYNGARNSRKHNKSNHTMQNEAMNFLKYLIGHKLQLKDSKSSELSTQDNELVNNISNLGDSKI